MIPLLFAILLLVKTASAQQLTSVAPTVQTDFDDCVANGNDVSFFENPSNLKCSNLAHKSGQFSARLFTSNANFVAVLKPVTVAVGSQMKVEFWIRVGDGSAPYPLNTANSIDGRWRVDTEVEAIQITPVVPDVPPTDGWYMYQGLFTPMPIGYSAPQIANVDVIISFLRNQDSQIISQSVWMDDFKLGLDTPLITGDPIFRGLSGQEYQVHGIDGAVYNLVSSSTTQVNSRFVFLDKGSCPIFNSIPASNCWAHAGSYLGAIGVQQVDDDVKHKVTIVSGPASQGFASLIVDDVAMTVNDTVAHGDVLEVTYVSSHVIKVNTADFAFTFENSDMFINQGVTANRHLSQLTCHGLFGQTHKRVLYPSKLKYIEGEVDDYLIAENDLFGHEFLYNQFQH